MGICARAVTVAVINIGCIHKVKGGLCSLSVVLACAKSLLCYVKGQILPALLHIQPCTSTDALKNEKQMRETVACGYRFVLFFLLTFVHLSDIIPFRAAFDPLVL